MTDQKDLLWTSSPNLEIHYNLANLFGNLNVFMHHNINQILKFSFGITSEIFLRITEECE